MHPIKSINKIGLIWLCFLTPVLAVPLSNNDFAGQLLDEIWAPWVEQNKEVTYGYTLEWDREDEIAAYYAQKLGEYIQGHSYNQNRDPAHAIIIKIQNPRLDFNITRAGIDDNGESRYSRTMKAAFDLLTREKISHTLIKNERLENQRADTFDERDLTFVLSDPFVVEPRVHFPVSDLPTRQMLVISSAILILATLLYFIRG